MALVRILVDGYSLLHNWPELAEGHPRYSERARDELVQVLTRYHDATGEPITVFFDGRGPRKKPASGADPRGVEVLFSSAGQTADDLIERAAHRFQSYGEVLVVTDDTMERDVVGGMGGSVASCANFIRMIGSALNDLADEVKAHNRVERNRYKRPR